MKYRLSFLIIFLFLLQGCYIREMRLVDPLKEAEGMQNLRHIMVSFQAEIKGSDASQQFVQRFRQDLERRLTRELGLDMVTAQLPLRKTYEGLPSDYLKLARSEYQIHLVSAANVDLKEQILQGQPAWGRQTEAPEPEIRLDLEIQLRFWSTKTGAPVLQVKYHETGSAPIAQRAALETALMERVNARLIRQLLPTYTYITHY